MPSSLSLTYKDRAGQKSNARFTTRDMDAANHDALKTEMNALATAIDGICLGNLQKKVINAEDTQVSNGNASDAAARRELKWLVTYEDNDTAQLYTLEIPCPKVTTAALFKEGDWEYADLNDEGPVAAFVTAFQAVVRTPDLHLVTVKTIKIVGRNL